MINSNYDEEESIRLDQFKDVLEQFLNKWQDVIYEYFAKNFETLEPSMLRYKIGKRYVKVSKCDNGSLVGSVSAFIDMDNGDIYKSASSKAPAKHARGNIYSNINGMEAIDESGYVKYLR